MTDLRPRAALSLVRRGVMFELRLYRSLLRWFARRPAVPGGDVEPFTYAKTVTPVMWLWIFASAAELPLVHVLIPWEAVRIALLVVGERRPFALRPRPNRYTHDLSDRGAVVDLAPGHGDLLVMGGGCQAGWEHSVPRQTYRLGPRLSVQWRWTSRTGRQERGGSYGDPVHFSRR